MPGRPLTRRDFVRRSAAAAAGLALSGCTPSGERGPIDDMHGRPRPAAGRDPTRIETRWPIKRFVYLMLENRSFDNLFGRYPGANGATTGVRWGEEVQLRRCPEWLPGDLPHDTSAALASMNGGAMDGFAIGEFGAPFAYTQFVAEDIPNYWTWAQEYVLCDNFFASALGPSYPNHLYFIAGQAGGAMDNPLRIQTRREPNGVIFKSWGCDAYGDDPMVVVEKEDGTRVEHSTCFRFETVGEQLSKRDIDWAYYSATRDQAGYIWQAYSAIEDVFTDRRYWREHIHPVDALLQDIRTGSLPSVTWVTPRYQLSDHPPFSTGHAHNWVTDIVNAAMRSSMWEEITIFVTWDEWGGFYDHVLPPRIDHLDLGFRVPMLVISPYARRGYVDDAFAEFSAPLRFVAENWGLPHLTERIRRSHDFSHAFDFRSSPRAPQPVGARAPATGAFYDWPEEFPGWPEDVEPSEPKIRYP